MLTAFCQCFPSHRLLRIHTGARQLCVIHRRESRCKLLPKLPNRCNEAQGSSARPRAGLECLCPIPSADQGPELYSEESPRRTCRPATMPCSISAGPGLLRRLMVWLRVLARMIRAGMRRAYAAMGIGPSGPHRTVWVLLRLPAQGHVIQDSSTVQELMQNSVGLIQN